jgi:hypothetical protein
VPNFDTAYVTDYTNPITTGGHTYTNIGNLLGVSNTVSELTTSTGEITVSLSGIPTNSISDLFNQEIKGSDITIYRAFFNPNTHQPINVNGSSNVLQKFKGIVTNYSISDSVDLNVGIALSTITLTCASKVEILNNFTNGRRTNPADFPDEYSMNKVRALANSNYNFGAP